jgi:radical SAM superfamily enzyme YgiQ (UPF0313 family)
MISVAFINPPQADWSLANNFAYLMFQSHYKRFGRYVDDVTWLAAPYKFDSYSNVQDIYAEVPNADIYLLSSYVWNYTICDELAEYIKQTNSKAICVLGGPHIGINDKEFLATRKIYDFILKSTKPGEIFVTELIDLFISQGDVVNYDQLTWEIRSNKTCEQFMPEYSVYEEHLDYLKTIREYARIKKLEPFSVLETTRGCPYQCAFCEWGGGIGSKIYKKPIEIVKKDILALKDAGFRDVYLADANFGVFFERDLEIFKFAWNNGINLTDVSTVKNKDLKKRIALIDAWFDVVGTEVEQYSPVEDITDDLMNPRLAGEMEGPHFISVVPTISLQSISEEAMRIAKRNDLSLENKIKLGEHIKQRCQEEDYPVPSLELILGMPGSTIEDFYEEMNLLWNFHSWGNYRHDYMFLPDTDLYNEEYLKKYNIELVEVYTDLIDDSGVDNDNTLYKNRKQFFKTIAACYSYSREEMHEMWFMNIAENYLLKNIYPKFKQYCSAGTFGKVCFKILSSLEGFDVIMDEITDILNPSTPARNSRRINDDVRSDVINNFIVDNYKIIINELFINIDLLVDPIKEDKKIIPIVETWN